MKHPEDYDTRSRVDEFPRGIPYIVGNEAAERFSFYGMKAILYIYLTALYVQFVDEQAVAGPDLASAKAKATEVVHLFMAGVYAFPLIGALLADRLFGKYRVIIWLSLVYCLGHAVLAVAGRMGELSEFGSAEWLMYSGLGLIAIGSGGIKPCVSANVGDQFTAANSHLVTKVYQIFYFVINYGSFFSTLLTPLLYAKYGPEVAFGVPGILMGVATLAFWLGRHKFTQIPPKPGGLLGLLDVASAALLLSPIFALIYGYFIRFEHFKTVVDGVDVGRTDVFYSLMALFTSRVEPKVPLSAVAGSLFTFFLPLLIGTAVTVGVGFALFALRQRIQPDNGFLAVLVYSFKNQRLRKSGQGFFGPAADVYGQEAAEGPPAVLKIMVVFSFVSVFWALFDQHASTWVEQATQMALTVHAPWFLAHYLVAATIGLSAAAGLWILLWVSNVKIGKRVIQGVLGTALLAGLISGLADLIKQDWLTIDLLPSQVGAVNALFVMIVIPLLNVAVYAPLRKFGIEVRPLQKMAVGMFLAASAFVVAALFQTAIQSAGEGKVHALWQVVQYFIMTTAEVLISVTGLEFAYTQAPRAMKSTIMGFWLLCVTFGNLLVAFLAPLQVTLKLSEFFWLFATVMGLTAVLFVFVAVSYRGKTYIQDAAADTA